MSMAWSVKVDERPYNIRLKGNNLILNEEKSKLNTYLKKRGWIQGEYEIPVGSKKAMLYVSGMMGGTKLVIDGKDCATGKDYVPVSIPKWCYIFLVLHMINFVNGALGVLLAFLGCSITISVSSNQKFNIFVKIILDFAVLILSYAFIFGIALAMYNIY